MKSIILILLTLCSFADEFKIQQWSISNSGYFQNYRVSNDILGDSRARNLADYSNLYRANTVNVKYEARLTPENLEKFFLFISAEGQYQLGKHEDPHVKFFDFSNEVEVNSDVKFVLKGLKKLDNGYLGLGFNEIEIGQKSYMYREESDNYSEDEVRESHLRSKVSVGPSYGVYFDGVEHFFFIKTEAGYTVMREDILDDQEFINLGVGFEYRYKDIVSLYTNYKLYLNDDASESNFEIGIKGRLAKFTLLGKDFNLDAKFGYERRDRTTHEYELDADTYFIGLELRF